MSFDALVVPVATGVAVAVGTFYALHSVSWKGDKSTPKESTSATKPPIAKPWQTSNVRASKNVEQAPPIELPTGSYDYDLLVIGGGSGGLACSKAAAGYGKKVACLDFVKPSPSGTQWGLGGTCVNVGCIPKKLMHQAAILGHSIKDATAFGWDVPKSASHNWGKMREEVQNHIGSLNWGYKKALRDASVKYINAYGSFVDEHTLKLVDKKGKESTVTAAAFVIATGGRPTYPDIPGAKEFGITSDDLFSLQEAPGKTLVVGASYVALECAGFLAGLGFDTTVMVRSILLRGFDQECAEKIGDYMAKDPNLTFIRPATPSKLEKTASGKIKVSYDFEGKVVTDEFDTVLFAVGRYACTTEIGLDTVGVEVDARNKKIKHNVNEQTNVPHIFAIGDVLLGKLELTPVAIKAGLRLAARMYNGSSDITNYKDVPTTVFTPLEYGAIGYSEEDAISKFGESDIEVFHQTFTPLEYTVAHRTENTSFAKLICNKSDGMKVVGLHILGPNSGEVTQGFGLGFAMGATKDDFDSLVGIHPTVAETFTTMAITKASGKDANAAGC